MSRTLFMQHRIKAHQFNNEYISIFIVKQVTFSSKLRLTLQVTDVLRLRRRALRSKDQQPQNVVERNRTKGVSPTAVLRNLAAVRRRSSYRMLNAVSAYPTLPYYVGFIDVFYHDLTV